MAQTINNKKKRTIIIIVIVSVLGLLCILYGIIGVLLRGAPESLAAPTQEEIIEVTGGELPTKTTKPTNTPRPTNTPKPTHTPLPPTETPDPIILSGSGDEIVDFDNPYAFAIIHVIGNSASRHFAIKNYGANGEEIDLLVNTTEPYDGIRPLDFIIGDHTTKFEIKATGDWSIAILPLMFARDLEVPGVINGDGDEVITLGGSPPYTAKIIGNAEGRHFSIVEYGTSSKLLVNTTEPYEGTVILDFDTVVLVITAVGEWSIDVKTR